MQYFLSFFGYFVHSSIYHFSAEMVPHIDPKKVCTLNKHSDTKILCYHPSSFPWHLSLLFLQNVSQSRNVYENNIILLSDPAKSGLVSGARIDGYDYQNEDKKIHCVRYFFRAVYYNKYHVIPRSVIAVILDVILNILQH